jgi:hypothetical protein
LKLLDTSAIQGRYHLQIDAQIKELAFGKADETIDIDRYQDRAKAGEVDTAPLAKRVSKMISGHDAHITLFFPTLLCTDHIR